LPLKIGQIDIVEIDDAEGPDSGGCQIKRGRRSKSSGADAQNARSFESILTLGCDLGDDEVTRVALQLFNAQSHRTATIVINDASLHATTVQ
jgi:hypothetical protein